MNDFRGMQGGKNMTTLRKIAVLILTLTLVFGLAAPGLEVQAASEGMVDIGISGYTDYSQIFEILDLVNEARAAEGLHPLKYDSTLGGYAETRAAECYVYYSHTRPDGSDLRTMFQNTYQYSSGIFGENIAMGQSSAQEVVTAWLNSPGHRANILNANFNFIGIGMFYQEDGSPAWVQLFHSNGYDVDFGNQRNDVAVNRYTLEVAPANLAVHVAHPQLTSAYCAVDFYEGMTMDTQLYLVNPMLTYSPLILVENDDYAYVSSDTSVFTVNNTDHTITAVTPGSAALSVRFRNWNVSILDDTGRLTNAVNVDVKPMPKLTYEKKGNVYAIDYSGFTTVSGGLTLWIKGNHDEMWTMGNIEADRVYDFYPMDLTDTYVCVMRYYDAYLDEYVEVGERLVIQLGSEKPDLPEPSEPEETEPVPDTVYLEYPKASELPQWNAEPTVGQIQTAIADLTVRYPAGTVMPDTIYRWNGGIDGPNYDLEVLSDMLFGTLPCRVIDNATIDDIRPGDMIFCDANYPHIMLVTEVTKEYVYGISVVSQDGEYSLSNDVLAEGYVEARGLTVYTRYASEPTGVASSMVPAGATVIAQGDCSRRNKDYYGNVTGFSSVVLWSLTSDGTLYITGRGRGTDCTVNNDKTYGWSKYTGQIRKVVIGDGITGLADEVFYDHDALETVVLGKNMKELGENAFANCGALKTVVWNEKLEVVGDYAFAKCTALTEIELPESVKVVGSNAFEDCSALSHIELPAKLKEIGEEAFMNTGITELVVPGKVKTLGARAFANCQKLSSVTLPGSIQSVGEFAFSNCDALTDIRFAGGYSTMGTDMFTGCDGLKTVTIPGTVKEIPRNAFVRCYNLEKVVIEAGVEVIDMYAFNQIRSITELHLPNTLKQIKQDAFGALEGGKAQVYFYGSQNEWYNIQIDSGNYGLQGWEYFFIFLDPNACRHNNTTVLKGYDPTCTANGLTDGVYCNDCGETVTAQKTIAALSHSYVAIVSDPTCTEGGHTTYTCSRCGDGYVSDYTDPMGHYYVKGFCINCGAEEECVVPVNPFSDVKDTDYFLEPVLWAVECGITAGTGNGKFSPNQTCTRGQVVTFLWRAMGEPEPVSKDNPFSDVKPSDYFYKPVLWAVENGITSGTGNGKFSPEQSCTRGQVVTFLWRTMGWSSDIANPFTDVKAQDYFYEPVLWAVENGITSGTSKTTFAPGSNCTRGQVVTFLYRAMN